MYKLQAANCILQKLPSKRSSMSDKEEEEMPKPSKNKKMRRYSSKIAS
jgi:hypothetical protein